MSLFYTSKEFPPPSCTRTMLYPAQILQRREILQEASMVEGKINPYVFKVVQLLLQTSKRFLFPCIDRPSSPGKPLGKQRKSANGNFYSHTGETTVFNYRPCSLQKWKSTGPASSPESECRSIRALLSLSIIILQESEALPFNWHILFPVSSFSVRWGDYCPGCEGGMNLCKSCFAVG